LAVGIVTESQRLSNGIEHKCPESPKVFVPRKSDQLCCSLLCANGTEKKKKSNNLLKLPTRTDIGADKFRGTVKFRDMTIASASDVAALKVLVVNGINVSLSPGQAYILVTLIRRFIDFADFVENCLAVNHGVSRETLLTPNGTPSKKTHKTINMFISVTNGN
jgi:hypothetical protein